MNMNRLIGFGIIAAVFAAMFGFVGPIMFSAKSDIAVFAGIGFFILAAMLVYIVAKIIAVEVKKES